MQAIGFVRSLYTDFEQYCQYNCAPPKEKIYNRTPGPQPKTCVPKYSEQSTGYGRVWATGYALLSGYISTPPWE